MKVVSIIICLLPLKIEGAIVYREVATWEIFDSSSGDIRLNIDLNNDGVLDFYTTNGSQADFVPLGKNRVFSLVATLPELGRSVAPLLGGESISLDIPFPWSWNGLENSGGPLDDGGAVIYMCNGRGPIGERPVCNSVMPQNELRYVGLELDVGGETHYGWVALSADLTVIHTMQIYGWAYETEPGKPIIAGAVPEPSAMVLVILAAGVLLRRKR